MVPQLWLVDFCASAFASWRSGMACNCRSLIFRRNDAPKRIPRMIRESNELHSATTGRVVPTRRSNRVTIFTAVHFVGLWPRLCEKSQGCYDSFFESAGGSDGCQALWKGLNEANAHFYLPCFATTW